MPTYQYRCRDCDEELEVVQAFTDDALTVCPNCKGNLRKVFAAPGISFKGSGFYKNDSRGTKSSTTNGTTPDGEKATKDSKDSKSDSASDPSPSKPDTKSDTKSDKASDKSTSGSGDKKSSSAKTGAKS